MRGRKMITVLENELCTVEYDKEEDAYRVSVFKDCHFQDELWFDAYEDNRTCLLENALETIKRQQKYIDMIVERLEELADESLYGECDDVPKCIDYCAKCYLDRAIDFVKGVQSEEHQEKHKILTQNQGYSHWKI